MRRKFILSVYCLLHPAAPLFLNPRFKQIVKIFQKLPGIGPRQAARLVLALLQKSKQELQEIGGTIANLQDSIHFCKECFNVSASPEGLTSSSSNEQKDDLPTDLSAEASAKAEAFLTSIALVEKAEKKGLCHICSDNKRDFAKMLIVESITDLDSIEKTGLYKGLYHVLGGAINPLDGAIPETLKFKELRKRVDKLCKLTDRLELIIATNPNSMGETTSLYLKELFGSANWRKRGVFITRLGRGLASGSNLEYADETTLKHSLEYRK